MVRRSPAQMRGASFGDLHTSDDRFTTIINPHPQPNFGIGRLGGFHPVTRAVGDGHERRRAQRLPPRIQNLQISAASDCGPPRSIIVIPRQHHNHAPHQHQHRQHEADDVRGPALNHGRRVARGLSDRASHNPRPSPIMPRQLPLVAQE